MYRHLHPLINFLICSQVKDIHDQAYTLVRMAMISTGNGIEARRSHFAVVISFLCDAVSTIGNNLYSYLNQMHQFLLDADFNNGDSVSFSPLVICILQNASGMSFVKIPVVVLLTNALLIYSSVYQVNVRMLAKLIYKLLHEKFADYSPVDEHPKSLLCEWPLKNLFEFVCNILDKRPCVLHSVLDGTINKVDNSFTSVLVNVEELLRHGKEANVEGLAVAFMSSIICAPSDDIIGNLPLVLTIIHLYFPLLFSLLSSVFLLDQKLFAIIWEYWIETFFSGVDMVSQTDNCGYGGSYGCVRSVNKEVCSTEKSILKAHPSSREFAASTLLSFLKYSPFYVLFSSVLCFSSLESSSTKFRNGFPSNKMLKVLEDKISKGSIDISITRLKYMLFWTFQLISSYKEKQSYITSELLQICFSLIETSIDHLEAAICNQTGLDIVGEYSVGHYAQVIVELMVSDPILSLCISNPLYFSKTIAAEMLGNSVGSFITSLKQYIDPVDNSTQRMLRKILGFFFAVCHSFSSSKTHASASMTFITVQKGLIHRILLSFKEKFEQFLVDKNLETVLPIFYMLDSSMDFMSPFDLLEVVHWMLCKIESISGSPLSLKYAASMGFYVANCSFDKICSFLQGPGLKFKHDISLNESIRSFDASIVPKVFYQILDFTLCFNDEQGDLCLQKVVNAVNIKVSLKSFPSLFALHALFSSMVFNSPRKMVMYCLYPTSKIKAKTLLLLTESLKVANEVAAKLSYMRLLLFIPKSVASRGEEIAEGISMEKEYGRLNHAKFRFLSILFNSLDHVVKQFPLKVDSSMASCATHCYHVFRFLEHLFLKEIVWLSKELQGYLADVSSLSFVNHFIMSSLFHRFEDPVTLNAIRCILVTLPVSKFRFVDVLEHLIGHSSFVKVILCTTTDSISSSIGTLLQPLTSILKLVGDLHVYNVETKVVIIVELSVCRVIVTLLIATTSQMDLELFHLMLEVGEIEGPDKGSMEALDYMWGVAALKMRKEKAHDVLSKSILTSTLETVEERKVLFRENIPVDSLICASTVLYICSDESSTATPMSLEYLVKDTSFIAPKLTSVSRKGTVQPYNATFILRFSLHSLLMGYLEPVEFARLGLLAVTFASISSPDEVVRKLGYECLGRFKNCLEHCQRSKDSLQLQLLLTWVQNGVTTAWQKIPSVIAIFAAEASFTSLDHSQNHSLAISKFLMRLPSVNLKVVPLFDTFFGNNSIHFKTDRLWILRLLYAGLNSDDDARIYLKNNILDLLLSYFSSSLADADFKILTLMIVRKCVHLPILARHLIKVVGLLPWLSSLLLFYGERMIEHHEQSSLGVMNLILKIVNDVISTGMFIDWLQDCALEQLSELSLIALKLLVRAAKLLKGDLSLVNAMLSLVVSTLRMSQKRSISQPHFFVAFESLCKLFEVIIIEYGNMRTTIDIGLQAILMNTPVPVSSHEDKSRLTNFVAWCIPSAPWPILGRKNLKRVHHPNFFISSEQCMEETLLSKLLRWASASVVLGSSRRSRSRTYSSRNETLLSYLDGISAEACRIKEECTPLDETLAVLVLHLEGFLSRKSSSPSTVSALCILLLNNSSITGVVKEFLDQNTDVIQSLCSKIRSPDEANPDWRWFFDEPWKNPSMCRSEVELVEEEQACRSLLVVFSNALGVAKPQGFPALSLQELESSGLFQWETEQTSSISPMS
ncbi:hypothetical protein HPP92_009340 [Vanilla planifolia]|uniref:URB1 C-terminal domain-containing protein n=1 Tax=Vanilla planifolia TaxID=51239 RepID=A0A835RFP0_VANPL|nr:hypothetical protein HPP92_009340 [Vanilla planifolia]